MYSMNYFNALKKVRIVLCNTSHPGNIGSVARAMKNMGLIDLYLVNPKDFPSEQSLAKAAGASDILDNVKVVKNIDEALVGTTFCVGTTCRHRVLTPEKLPCKDVMNKINEELLGQEGGVALIFGNERNGLTANEMGKCNAMSWVPCSPMYPSLNLSHAVQIFCYELFQTVNTVDESFSEINQHGRYEDLEYFLTTLETVMIKSGYTKRRGEGRVKERMQRLFRRARIEKEELDILLGFLKSVR